MAEPESILQLGIEAARENKKQEARELFRLLTRQEPNNTQGWLWLAGVAENREERQAALERVLELDPSNEMARANLEALRTRQAPPPAAAAAVVLPPTEPLPPVVEQPVASAPAARIYERPADPDPLDDDPFAELNNLSDVMADDKAGPVRRNEPVVADVDAAAVSAGAAAASAEASARAARSAERSADRSADRAAEVGGRVDRNNARYIEDDELEPPRRGLSPLLGLLLFLVGLGLIGLLFYSLLGGQQQVAGVPTGTPAAGGQAGQATEVLGGAPGAGGVVDPNATAGAGGVVDPNATAGAGGVVDPNATAGAGGTVDPNATAGAGGATGGATGGEAAPAIPDSQLAGASPAIIAANTPISSEGWTYDFPQATFAASIIGNLGQFTPNNGRFVVVLIHAINTTGSPQAIPANFFVLKDAQGRIWNARPEVSDAYVVPGVNADQTQNTPLPSDGNYRSVALIFDVAPDATDLTFFARSNPSQGWIVLRSV